VDGHRLHTGAVLAEAIAQRGPLGEAVRELGAALAEGLVAIHATGIIHRDLKPGNVIMADDGPRIIDFGIAKGADATELTASHAVIGSLRYMSPEQLNGEELTPQSDVFALGTILAYAATGHDPFAAPTVPAVINHILNDPPDLDPLTGDLRGIIGDCLAKDPGSRPTPGDLLVRFGHPEAHDPTVIAASEPVPAAVPPPAPPQAGLTEPERPAAPEPWQDSTISAAIVGRQHATPRTAQPGDAAAPIRKPQRWSTRRTGLIAAGVAAVVVLATVVAFALDRHPVTALSAAGTHLASSPPPSQTTSTTSPSATGSVTGTAYTPAGNPIDSIAFAPGGTTLNTGDSAGNIYLWNTGTGKITSTLTDPEGGNVYAVAFAPSGTTLATSDDDGTTYLWDTETGKIIATLTDPQSTGVTAVAFAPDSTTTLATGDGDGYIYLWNITQRKS
jgi:Protein kinase domain/WD domain, G-beta repeat